MILNYSPFNGGLRPRARKFLWLLTFCIVIVITLSWLSTDTLILQMQAVFYRSRLAAAKDDNARMEILAKWAKLVTKRGKPDQVFAIVPKLKTETFYGGTYATLVKDGPLYIWAGPVEAGVTQISVVDYIDRIGGNYSWPDLSELKARKTREMTSKHD